MYSTSGIRKIAKVREQPNLIRDIDNKALLYTDDSELAKYKEERNKQFAISQIVKENEQIKNDLAEIKNLLQSLLGQR